MIFKTKYYIINLGVYMAKNVLPYKKVIKETLQKEKAVIKLFKEIGIESKMEGALDFSFCNEIIALLS